MDTHANNVDGDLATHRDLEISAHQLARLISRQIVKLAALDRRLETATGERHADWVMERMYVKEFIVAIADAAGRNNDTRIIRNPAWPDTDDIEQALADSPAVVRLFNELGWSTRGVA